MLIKNILIVFSFLLITNLSAETFSKGSATIEIKKPKKISAEETATAKNKAIESAWKKYTSKFNVSRMKQYMLVKEDIISTLDDYINDVQVLDNTVDTGTKTLRTVVKISINEVALDAKLSLTSAAGGTASGEGSYIVAYYITREISSRKSYDAKETKITANETAKKATDSMEGDTDSVSTSDIEKTQTGGSSEQKADKLEYKLATNAVSPSVVTDAMNQILSPAGFEMDDLDAALEIADPNMEFFTIEMATIEKEFVETNRLSRKTKGEINKVIRELEAIGEPARYLVQVIADMNLPFQDSVTGNQKVTVSVSAQIRDVSQKRAKNVAAFTEQASGTGQDGKTAALNAMKNAATIVAEGIVDQLNAKGIN